MDFPINYIQHIQNGTITILNYTDDIKPHLEPLGATFSTDSRHGLKMAVIQSNPNTDERVATILGQLRDLDMLFLDMPHGWPPAAVYLDLRDKGLVEGEIRVTSKRRDGWREGVW